MIDHDYPVRSRVQRLPSFDTSCCECWVKRDDELGFGISGTKIRKYSSLLPHLLAGCFEEVVCIGGINSNNILGLSQLLVENRQPFRLYLRGDPARPLKGNGLLTSMIAGPSRIRWVSRQEWPQVAAMAQEETKGKRVYIVPEGACCSEAVPGALSLAEDIVRNERECGFTYDHIFIEAGTGLAAIALLQGLQRANHVHILLLADDEDAFIQKVKVFGGPFATTYTLYRPRNAASFGSVNARVMEEIRSVASLEGILLDPIYSAKLFFEARHIIQEANLVGRALVIHSGGALSLMGFSLMRMRGAPHSRALADRAKRSLAL